MGVLAGDDDVAGQAQAHAAGQAVTLNRGQNGLSAPVHFQKQPGEVPTALMHFQERLLARKAASAEICPGAEIPAGADQDDRRYRGILVCLIKAQSQAGVMPPLIELRLSGRLRVMVAMLSLTSYKTSWVSVMAFLLQLKKRELEVSSEGFH